MDKLQEVFNILVSAYLIVLCTVVFVLSWWFNKPVDISQLLIILAPLLPNIAHVISNGLTRKQE